MALLGTHLRTLDDKRRLAVPKRIKDEFGQADIDCLVVAPGTEKSLVLFSQKGFDQFAGTLPAMTGDACRRGPASGTVTARNTASNAQVPAKPQASDEVNP